MRYTKLPYDFDLNFDIKDMEDVEIVVKGGPIGSDATPNELADMFIALGMEIPECLSSRGYTGSTKVYLTKGGAWWTSPPKDEPVAVIKLDTPLVFKLI